MRPAAPLWELYDEWKDLTERERGAIEGANWVEVRRCQKAKQQLQPRIVHLTGSLKAEATSESERGELNSKIRICVNELIALETRNSSVLDRRMAELEKERATLDETSNRLRKVHQTYAPASSPVWNQYS